MYIPTGPRRVSGIRRGRGEFSPRLEYRGRAGDHRLGIWAGAGSVPQPRPASLPSLLLATFLLPLVLLSPHGWCASKLRPCELVLRLQTLQPVVVEDQVVEAGPGRSGLVP
jgi:hypothetical protein